ncbi:Sporulation-related protein, YtrI [Geobacillus sp. WSUCF1]|nr:Sporulation-related protein, YtrI [Geobacillus sp. WSUCF1]
MSHLITKDIETVYNSRELIERAIENKTYTIHEKTYRLELHTLTIFTLLAVEVKLTPLS